MKSFSTSIKINSTAERVWELLVDLPNWTNWNTTIEKVTGTVAKGHKVTVYTKLSPGQGFPVKVSTLEAPAKMVWTGGMPLGLFTGQRTYTLNCIDNSQVQFEMTEVFSGLLAPLITKSIPDLQPAFNEFAACLKQAAEQS